MTLNDIRNYLLTAVGKTGHPPLLYQSGDNWYISDIHKAVSASDAETLKQHLKPFVKGDTTAWHRGPTLPWNGK